VQTGDIIRFEMLSVTREVVDYAIMRVGQRSNKSFFPLYDVLVLDSNRWPIGHGEWTLDAGILKACERIA
jgi:hypothetical protein